MFGLLKVIKYTLLAKGENLNSKLLIKCVHTSVLAGIVETCLRTLVWQKGKPKKELLGESIKMPQLIILTKKIKEE